jgi:pimeloyl-ACP methyl ester carboxylesterase
MNLEADMPLIEISPGFCLNYLETNSASPEVIVLLHGLGANSESWGLQLPVLSAAGYRVIAPDARGFGQSSYPAGARLSVELLAQDVSRLLDRLSVARAAVAGISMGGAIALALALNNPARVDRLVLVNTFARLRPRSPLVWGYFALRMILVHSLGLPSQAKVVAARVFPRPGQEEVRRRLYEQILQANPSGYRAAMRALAVFDVHRRLGELRCPTLVLTGDRDTTVAMSIQAELVRGIPEARQVTIPDAGHGVIADQPEAVNRVLLEFLAG